jgi:hypothetical protein
MVSIADGIRGAVAPVVKVAEAVGRILKILALHVQFLPREQLSIQRDMFSL